MYLAQGGTGKKATGEAFRGKNDGGFRVDWEGKGVLLFKKEGARSGYEENLR